MDVTGRNLISGLPRKVRVAGNEILEALEEPMQLVFEAVHNVLERTPPELSADISANGICMTGGGSLLYGLDRMLAEKTKVPCYVAEDAVSCVAIGTGKALEDLDSYTASAVRDYKRGEYFNL